MFKNLNREEFEKIKEKSTGDYKEIKEVYSPYFKENISFNTKALEHLSFKNKMKARPVKDQYMRYKLLYLAPTVVNLSTTLQGISIKNRFEPIKTNNRWENILKKVTYYEFISIIKRERVKIIIKQIEDGKKFFWSIIPYWKMDKNTLERLFYDEDPEDC